MKTVLVRAVRDMRAVAKQYMRFSSGAISDASITHVAYLLLAMQLMSQALTALLKHEHPFYSDERNASLDTSQLLLPPPPDLLKAAARRTDVAFWNSVEVLPWYWPLHLRVLLRAKQGSAAKVRHPGTRAVMMLRINAASIMARRLCKLLTDALASVGGQLRRHKLLNVLLVRLHAFTRDPDPRQAHDADPDMVLARHFHHEHYAGDVGAMDADTADAMQATLARIGATYGKQVQAAISLAALRGGATNEDRFYAEDVLHDGESELTAVDATLGVVDTARFILTQRAVLRLLASVLDQLRGAADEEAALDVLLDSNPDLEREDLLALPPLRM